MKPAGTESLSDIFCPPDRHIDASHVYADRADQWKDAYHAAFTDCMTGCAAVFQMYPSPPNAYDSEQFMPIMAAIGFALKRPDANAATIGLAVLRAVAEIANEYASFRADLEIAK